ncbi:MAG: IS256 family transposase [Methanothrix sp.]|uniref:IS256 family transposase n=1 Tax=Methanothrix sp. TaxID=90426 RepID=UPI0032B00D0A|nr:IS256 family transposase [Methanothrix sp.]
MIPVDLLEDYLIDQEEGLKKLLTYFLNLVMQLEAIQQSGAEPYQRSESRKAHRNGYKERSLKTRVGEITLKKPQFREMPFETKVFERYSRVEKALISAVAESYIQGVSTRRIKSVVSQLGLEYLSASSVSRLAKELDDKVEEFLKRPIERPVPYIFVDASYFKVRDGPMYVTKAFMIVTGIRDDGYREILGARIADGEDENFWYGLFQELKDRGLSGVKLVVSDGHKGIQSAVESSFLGASWQMCHSRLRREASTKSKHVHFIRAVLRNVARKDLKEIADKLKLALEHESMMDVLVGELEDRGYSKAIDTIDRFRFGLWNYKSFPREHWKRIQTTNSMERIHKELKRRSRVVGAFPSDNAFIRLAVSILMDINEEWMTSKRYLTMDNSK